MQVTDYVSAIIVGIVIGMLGRLVLPGKQRIGGFSTFVIGMVAALLGMFVSDLFNVDRSNGVHLWKLHWNWIVLALQVGFAVIGIAVANVMTYTRLGDGAPTPRRRARKRRTSRA